MDSWMFLKEEGDKFFKLKAYQKACDHYQEAFIDIQSKLDETCKLELKVEAAKITSNISFMYLKLSKEGNDETLLQNARKYAMLSISHNPNWIKGYLRLAEACKESEQTEDILNAITLYLNNNKDAATVLNDDFKKLLQQVKYYTHNKVMKLSPSWDLLKYKSNVYVIDPLGAGHFKNFEEFISYYGTSVQKISLLVRPGTYVGSYVLTNATINIVGDCNIEINPITKAIDKNPTVVFTNTLQPTKIAIEKMSCPHKIPSTFFFEGCEVTLQRISVYGEVEQYSFQAINCQSTHLKLLQCSFVSTRNSGLCCSENSKLDCESCCSVGGYNGVVIASKSHAKLSHCFVSKMDCVGIIANDQAEMIILKHCTVTKCKRQGLVVYNEVKMAKVIDSFFKHNGSRLINVASIHFKCCKVVVENTSVRSPGCTGIGIEGGSGSYNNLNIKNCDTGLLVQANVQISNCTIKSSNIGIQVTGAVTLENNKISKCFVKIAKSDGSPMPIFKGGKKNAVISMPPLDEVTQSAFKGMSTRDVFIGSDYDRLGLNEINCNHSSLNREVIYHIRLSKALKKIISMSEADSILTVGNNVDKTIVVKKAHNPDCCWTVTEDDKDCESMVLFGGFPAEIKKASTKNITYVFPNMYPLDRIGSCNFHLKEPDGKAIVHKVPFNTSTTEVTGSWMEELFKGGAKVWKQCDSVDMNWRNSCHPYDCTKKYNGFRSFYRQDKKRCEPVTQCLTKLDVDDKLPTSAFDYENNMCKDLLPKDLTKKEKKVASELLDHSELSNQRDQYMEVNPDDVIIHCKNGKQVGTHCRCKKGWRSVAVTTEGGGVKMDWCSKKVRDKDPGQYKPSKILRIILIVILVSICIFLVLLLLFLWWRMFTNDVITRTKNPIQDAEQLDFHPDTKWMIGNEMYDSNQTYENKNRKELLVESSGESDYTDPESDYIDEEF